MSYVFLTAPLHEHKCTCLPICNDETARARPYMNIKVAAYVIWDYTSDTLTLILIITVDVCKWDSTYLKKVLKIFKKNFLRHNGNLNKSNQNVNKIETSREYRNHKPQPILGAKRTEINACKIHKQMHVKLIDQLSSPRAKWSQC